MPVVFHVPEVDAEIRDDLVDLILAELTLTARPNAPFDAEQAARTIADVRSGAMRGPVRLEGPEHLAVLRVLDNLRRRGKLHSALILLRDRLLNDNPPPAIDYSVRSIGELVDHEAFTSYAGPFAAEDRLLLRGSAWRVTAVEPEQSRDRDRLVCAPFPEE